MTSDDLPHQVKTKDREREERVKEFQRQRDAVQRERARLQVIATQGCHSDRRSDCHFDCL
jgi:hypothetical protein